MTKSLASLPLEQRETLLRFGAAATGQCAVVLGPTGYTPACGQPAPWFVRCESATAGVTTRGVFHPAQVGTRICTDHLRILNTEPRQVYDVVPAVDQIPVTVINLDGVL